MNAEEILRTYIESFARADLDALATLYATTTSYRQPMAPTALTTPSEVKEFESGMFALFDDVNVETVWLVADEAQAAAGVVVRARQTGDLPTPDGVIPAKGARIALEICDHIRVDANGKIVDHQRYSDVAGFIAQLTADPG